MYTVVLPPNYPGKRPQTVCVCVRSRGVAAEKSDLDALGSSEIENERVRVSESE